jgi:hypothetical protein
MEIAREIGLQKILSTSFPENWQQILAAAFYMSCEGNVMAYLEDWYDETNVSFANRMNEQQCSQLFSDISFDERMAFFNLTSRKIMT